MPTVLLSIYRFQRETTPFIELEAAFERLGWNLVLWTNWNQGLPGVQSLPLVTKHHEVKWYRKNRDVPCINVQAIEEFNEKLRGIYGQLDPAYEPSHCISIAGSVFDAVKPDLFICWCGMNPLFSIPLDIARSLGIPSLIWEAGMLPNTFLLDRGGVTCDADMAGHPLPPTSDEDLLSQVDVILSEIRDRLVRQGCHGQLALPPKNGLPRILVLGGMDSANGVYRPKYCSQTILGEFRSGVDLANTVAQVYPKGAVLYRPHPREPKKPLSRLNVDSVMVDGDSLMATHYAWADVIIGYGSKTDMDVLALGKPLVVAGNTIISGKGIGFEARDVESLQNAISCALLYGVTAQQKEAIRQFFAYQIEQACYARDPTARCKQGLAEFAAQAVAWSGEPMLCKESGELSYDLDKVLSAAGHCLRDRLRLEDEVAAKGQIEVPSAYLQLRQSTAKLVILDFDHTLFFANSTELLLAKARPGLLAWGADLVSRVALRRLRQYGFWDDSYRDYVRVWASMLLCPWNLLFWKLRAGRVAEKFLDGEMLDAASAQGQREVWVVSNGFSQLIEPLLRPYPQVNKVICADLFRPGNDVRKAGKWATVSPLAEAFTGKIISVSDSLEDADMLHATKGLWIEPQRPLQTSSPAYAPFRYAAEVKHGWGWFTGQLVREDYLLLFLYVSHWGQIGAATCLFVSLFCIYELGYYRNDFVATKRESNPTLSQKHAQFEAYAIWPWAWVWALVTGGLGIWLLEMGQRPAAIVESSVRWLCVLVFIQVVFEGYNRLPTRQRGYVYPWLQAARYFGYSAVMSIHSMLMWFAAGLIAWRSINYWIYRSGGSKTSLSKNKMLLSVVALGGGLHLLQNGSFPALISAWPILLLSLFYFVKSQFFRQAMSFLRKQH
jgi:phosphoserine phosphatase